MLTNVFTVDKFSSVNCGFDPDHPSCISPQCWQFELTLLIYMITRRVKSMESTIDEIDNR